LKIILIISETGDYTTKNILEWLDYYGVSFLRLNYDVDADVIDIISGGIGNDIKNTVLRIKEKDFKLNEIKFIWYRRGSYKMEKFIKGSTPFTNRSLSESLIYYMSAYSNFKYEYLNYLFKDIPSIGGNGIGRINKLIVLELAKEHHLKVPKYIATTLKSELILFAKANESIINKSLDLSFTHYNSENDYAIMSYTNTIEKEDLNEIPTHFALSFFQEKIEKEYEIRTFFLGEEYYSMAILSQNDSQTAVDYRRYNKDYMNRVISYQLPIELEKKSKNLMSKLELTTGSIDFIKGKDRNYYFLEVNPVGQFGYVSYNCNFQLEKKIANYINTNCNG
jgi:ATP-GRASP peptide maturase of grasp-with-spasm system